MSAVVVVMTCDSACCASAVEEPAENKATPAMAITI